MLQIRCSTKVFLNWDLNMTKLSNVRDLIVVYLTDADGSYVLDPVLKTFVNTKDGK